MNDFQYIINFSEPATESHSRDLLINTNGVGFFINGCADSQEFEGEIGWYKGEIGPVLAESIKRCIESHSFLSGPEYPTEIMRGQPTKIFSFERDDSKRSYVFNIEDPLPDNFMELQEKYYEVINGLKEYPWKTLRVSIDLRSSSIHFGSYLDLNILFQNTGTSKIYFRNPSYRKEGTIDFSLEFAKKNVASEDISPDHFFSIDLKKLELLTDETQAISRDRKLLELDTAADLKTRCRCQIPKCSEGEYSVKLLFNTVGTEEDLENQEFIDGEVHTAEKTLAILRK